MLYMLVCGGGGKWGNTCKVGVLGRRRCACCWLPFPLICLTL